MPNEWANKTAGVRNAAVHPCTRPALPDSPADTE
jgi:hypothetical protein